MKYKAWVMFGAPGSGKGTQGKVLSTISGNYHLASGDIFRGLDPNSENSKLAASYSNRGELVPDEVTAKICIDFIEGLVASGAFNPEKQKLVLDGLPRTLTQAEVFDNHFDIESIIFLDTDDDSILIDRLVKRAEIEGRKDDTDPAVLENRLRVYKEQTLAVIDHYPKDVVLKVEANSTPARVLRDILIKLADRI